MNKEAGASITPVYINLKIRVQILMDTKMEM
jgi:hypothetical protein